jgi:vanillate O-demethylase monooxygenase subunit
MFLRNAWYVAAREQDLAAGLYPARILGEEVVLYRTESGDSVALQDTCPHRKLPLSMGRLMGDQVECGYHGLVFDRMGHCTRAPGASSPPHGARVRTYPVVSRYGFVWIWMGDPNKASSDNLVPVEHWADPAWTRNFGGAMTVDCNYLFVTDNLLDPSHVAWVHRTSFGNSACEEEPVTSKVSADGVTAARWIYNTEVAPFYTPLVNFEGRCDRLQQYEVRFPCNAIIRAIFTPAGTGGDSSSIHEKAFIMDSYNFMTPISANQTRYYWFQLRNSPTRDDQLSKSLDEGITQAFSEDSAVLTAVQRGFDKYTNQHIHLASDRAPLQFRRRLAKLVAEENPGSAVTDRVLSAEKLDQYQ